MAHPSNTDLVYGLVFKYGSIKRTIRNSSFFKESQPTLGEANNLEEVNNTSSE